MTLGHISIGKSNEKVMIRIVGEQTIEITMTFEQLARMLTGNLAVECDYEIRDRIGTDA